MQFIGRSINSKHLQRIYRDALQTKRGSLMALWNEINNAVEVLRNNFARQLIKYNGVATRYFTSHNWIYVVDDKNVLRTCYMKDDLADAGYKRL